jgi:hypothetical protein
MYAELERIAEIYGVSHRDVPAFLTDVSALLDRLVMQRQLPVEDWHGIAHSDMKLGLA